MCNVERRAKSSGVDSGSARTVQKQRQRMQQYFELVDWQGLKLPSAERRQRNSLKVLNAQSKCGKAGYVLRKHSQHLARSCLQRNCYHPSARNRVRIKTKRDASKATRPIQSFMFPYWCVYFTKIFFLSFSTYI